jgi:D-alanine--poly(phosphoribitol) ligase subunit 2
MSIETQVDEILFAAIEEINEQRPLDQKIKADKATLLFGSEATLDSLPLVNLLVAAERKVEETLRISINIVDERAMSQKNSPFKSVETLANYIVMLVKEQAN